MANDIIKVNTAPPINPYTVFLGDKVISLVLPKKYPTKYAKMSFVIIKRQGVIYHPIP